MDLNFPPVRVCYASRSYIKAACKTPEPPSKLMNHNRMVPRIPSFRKIIEKTPIKHIRKEKSYDELSRVVPSSEGNISKRTPRIFDIEESHRESSRIKSMRDEIDRLKSIIERLKLEHSLKQNVLADQVEQLKLDLQNVQDEYKETVIYFTEAVFKDLRIPCEKTNEIFQKLEEK